MYCLLLEYWGENEEIRGALINWLTDIFTFRHEIPPQDYQSFISWVRTSFYCFSFVCAPRWIRDNIITTKKKEQPQPWLRLLLYLILWCWRRQRTTILRCKHLDPAKINSKELLWQHLSFTPSVENFIFLLLHVHMLLCIIPPTLQKKIKIMRMFLRKGNFILLKKVLLSSKS